MSKRVLQLLGGAVAVAILAVGLSVAGADPSATAKVAGVPGCDDNYPPYSRWGGDWWGRDGDGRYWNGWGDGNGYFDGRSYDRGCRGYGNAPAAAGKVDRVMVAAKRLRGDRCQHLLRSGRLSRPGSCAATRWMRAKGAGSWRFDIPRDLPRGDYRLHRRAVDESGNREKQRLLHLRID
jgi:hypothetical protein